MNPVTLVRSLVASIADQIAVARRLSQFTCGDCEFSNRCGLPPTDDCTLRRDQIVRGDWKARREAKEMAGITVGCSWKP